MKLYYAPGTCSLAPHICLEELGITYSIEKVDTKTHTFAGGDYYKINPKGYVPALELDPKGNGAKELLSENIVILQYLADQKPEKQFLPAVGTWDRYRAMEWLTYISTEVHKSFSPLFRANTWVQDAAAKTELMDSLKAVLAKKFDYLEAHFKTSDYVLGAKFSAADAYLFTIMSWTTRMEMSLAKLPSLQSYVSRVRELPSVVHAMTAEGLR